MTPFDPNTPAPPGTRACPPVDELERFIVAGAADPVLAAHLSACAECQASATQIRENLDFIGCFLKEVDPNALSTSPPGPPATDILPGYRIVAEIARGGQGTVYEAVQNQTKRRVALKMLDPGPKASRARRRIEREAEIAAGLRHPNIVTIYDSAPLPDGRYALAMEFIDGVTLDEWARHLDAAAPPDRQGARRAVETKLRAFGRVCDAVQHAHQNGVIHRDLKPANVIVDAAGVPHVVDFGIARRVIAGSDAAGVTHAGEFAGTLAYASPEQVSGEPDAVDTRSDVYSLGVMLFEVLTGRRPYPTEHSLTGAVANITGADPAPLGAIQPGSLPADDELETIVRKALAKDRAHRYQTAGALAADIDNHLAGRAIDAKRESTLYLLRKAAARHRAAFAVAAGFLVILAALAVLMAWSARRLDRQRSLLADALSASTVERGRLSGIGGSSAQAEELIWPEMLRSGTPLDDPHLGFRSAPDATRAAWALFELYSRHPSLLNIPVMHRAQVAEFTDHAAAVRLVRPDGAQEFRSLPDGSFLRNYAPTLPDTVHPLTSRLARPFNVAKDADGLVLIDTQSSARRRLPADGLRDLIFAEATPDGRRIVTVDKDNRVSIWNVETGSLIARLGEGVSTYPRPSISDDGSLIVAGDGRFIRVWRSDDGSVVWSFRIPDKVWSQVFNATLQVAAISPDHRRVAAGFVSTLLVFDTQNPEAQPTQFSAHRGWVNFVGFSADSSVLLSSGSERDYLSWDLRSGTLLSSFSTSSALRGLPALSHDGSLAAICDAADRLRVWQTRPRRWLHRLTDPANSIFFVRFNHDGSLLAAASADGRARVWRSADRALLWTSPPPSGSPIPVTACCFIPGQDALAVTDREGTITIHDLSAKPAAATPPRPLALGPHLATWLGCTPDGSLLAVAGSEPGIRFYSLGSVVETFGLSQGSYSIFVFGFSPDGRLLAA
ncbi:MAG: WD40 repeat domain-containing serine/threonine protein kinase, partial [Phycisphaerales bacterium]